MPQWVRLCGVNEAPKSGEVTEVDVDGAQVCLANINGELHALDNICPHRQGPLGQGWIEGNAVLCPWHAWAFDVRTGVAEEPEHAQVKVYPVRKEGAEVFADMS
jgi:nitrite reductase (NADH) small subunit